MIARHVQLENTMRTKVARPMSVQIVPLEPLVQHVRLVVPIVQKVNFKPVLGNPVANIVQKDNINLQMVKRPVSIVQRVNTTVTQVVHMVFTIVPIVQLVHIPALVLHHVQIVQLDNTHRQVQLLARIVQVGRTNQVLVKAVA